MLGKLARRSLLGTIVALGLVFSLGADAHGAALTWGPAVGATNLNWGTTTNWSTNVSPVGNTITFTNSGAVSSGTSSIVDSNIAISSLAFLNSGAGNIQSIYIPGSTTLSVTGVGGVISGGTAITVTNPVVFSGPGAFTVNNASGPFILGPGSTSSTGFATTMTMSGLSTFNFSGSNFYVGFAQPGATRSTGGILYLASTSSITAPLLDVGDSNGQNSGSASDLYLSAGANTINANTIDVGHSKANGSLLFAATNGTAPIVTIRGSGGGTNRVTTFDIGDHSTGTGNNVVGTADFSSGIVNALITTLTIGSYENQNTGSGAGTFILGTNPNSIVDATTVKMASGGTSSVQSIGTLKIEGGTFAFGTFAAPAFGTANISITGGTIASDTTSSTMAPGFSMSGAVAFGQLTGYNGTLAFSGTIALVGNTTVATNVSTSYEGAISGAWPLTMSGPAPLTLSASNTYTGNTTINGGNLLLNFAAAGAPASNIINNASNSSALGFGGGSLVIQGSAGASNSQQFNGLSINSGVSTISLTSGGSGAASLSLGAISYSSGFMVFSLPASGSITTTTPDGILGPWATVAGVGFAAISGGSITAAPVNSYTSVSVLGGAIPSGSTNNIAIVDGGTSGPVTLVSPTTVISTLLQSATGNAAMIALSGGTLQAAGIMAPSGAQSLTIGTSPGDGSLSAATAGGALALYSGTSGLTVNSVIADNSSPSQLYTFGPGVTLLTAANTYTGPTTITGGTLQVGSGGSLGSGNYAGAIVNNGNLLFGTTSAQTLSGMLSGNGGLTMAGAGVLYLANSASSYSGSVNLSAGTVDFSSGGLGSASSITFQGGALQWAAGNTQDVSGAFVMVNSTTATLDTQGNSVTLATAFGSNSTGALVKIGTGTLTLTALETYSGNTLVSAGTLNLGGNTGDNNGGDLRNSTIIVPAGSVLGLSGMDVLGFASTSSLLVSGVVAKTNAQSETLFRPITLSNGTLTSTTTGSANGAWNLFGSVITTGSGTSNFINGIGSLSLRTSTSAFNLGSSSTLNISVPIIQYGGSTSPLNLIGSGLLVLSASNTYTGATNITGGTLQLGSGGLGPDGSIGNTSGIADNAALVYSLSGNQTAAYAVSGSGSLTKIGAGMLTLSGANTGFTGVVTLGAGTLQLGNAAALGPATAAPIVNGGVLDLHGLSPTIGSLSGAGGTILTSSAGSTLSVNMPSGATTYNGILANGAGTLSLSTLGNGMLTLTGSNTYSGPTNVSGGTLAVNGSLGSSTVNISGFGLLTGAGAIGGNASIAGNGVVNLGTGGMIAGTLTASGGNWNGQGSAGTVNVASGVFTVGNGATLTAVGPVSVLGGSLLLNGGTLNSGSPIAVNPGATVGGMGAAGSASIAAGGIVQAGYSGAGTLNFTSLAYNGNGTLNIGPLGNYTSTAALNVSGNNALSSGGTVTINIDSIPGPGVYDLVAYNGALQGSGTFQTSSLPNRAIGQLVNTGSQIDLNVSSTDFLHWTGSNSSAWDTTTQNWVLNSNGSPTTYINNPGDTVVFDNIAGANTSVVLTTALFPTSVTVSSSNNYTFSGSGSIGDSISGPTSLTLVGPGTLTIANTGGNTYTGGTAIQGGTLILGANKALPTAGTVTFGTSSSNGTLNLSGYNQTVAGLGIGSGATAAGQVITTSTGSPTLTYSGGASTFYGTIGDTGPGGGILSLTVGSGTLDVSGGTTSYYGATTVNGGRLLVGNLPNTSGVTVNGGSLFATSFNGSSQLTVASGASATFTGTNLSLTNLNGVSNAGSLAFTGTSGAITLQSLSGPGTTTFAAGANITLDDSGGSATVAGPLTMFELDGATMTVGGSASIHTALSGAAAVGGYASITTLLGATLTLNGPASITSATSGIANLNGPTASIGTLSNATVNLGNGAALSVTAGSQTSASIAGSGSLTSGPGYLVLASNNTYSGATTIGGGTLQVGNGGTTGSLPNTAIVDNGSLIYNLAAATATLPAAGISGSGTVSATSSTVIALEGNVITGGSQAYNAAIETGARTTGIEVGGPAPAAIATYTLSTTAAGSWITMIGDVGQENNSATTPLQSLILSTSSVNGTINLNISIGRADDWYNLGAFTANAGTGAINWTGSYGTAANQTTPITLIGAINFSSNFACHTALPMTLNATEPSSVSGVFSGPMSVVVGGPSILTVSNTETYTGSTTISGGTLQLGTGVSGQDGALNGTSGVTDNTALVYNIANTETAGYAIHGSGSVAMIGSGLQILSASSNYSGGTTIGGGTLELGTGVSGQDGSIGGTSGVTNNSALVYNLAKSQTAGYSINGSGSVAMIGGGLINLSASNGYSGGTYLSNGVLQLGNSAALGTGALAANGGTLDVNGFSVTVPSFRGAAGIVANNGGSPATLTTNQVGSTTFGGTLQDGFSQTSLTLNGSGRLTLAGNNTYSGSTTVNAGILSAGATNAFSPNSPVTVNAGVLDATAGSQSVAALTIGSSGSLNLYVGNVLTSNGAATFAMGSTLNISNSSAIVTPDLLMTYLGAATGTFTNVTGLPAADQLYYNSGGSLEIIAGGLASWISGSGNWSAGTNWSSGSQPNSAAAAALLNQSNSGAIGITLDVPVTLGSLQFASSTTSYALSGNMLTFNNNGGTSSVTVLSGTHSIGSPVVITGGNLDIAASNSSVLAISGNISDDGLGRSMILDGDGTGQLVLSGTNSYMGGTVVNSGTLVIDNTTALADGSSLTVGQGASSLFAPAFAAPPAVAPAGASAVPEPGALMLLLAALCSAVCYRLSTRAKLPAAN
jgi:fibronectin-binding autotransporter adhesin